MKWDPKNFAGKILPWKSGKPERSRISGKMLGISKESNLMLRSILILNFPFYTALLGLVNTMIPNELGHLKTHRKRQSHSFKKLFMEESFRPEKTRQK